MNILAEKSNTKTSRTLCRRLSSGEAKKTAAAAFRIYHSNLSLHHLHHYDQKQ
jgi:hypothetical protein